MDYSEHQEALLTLGPSSPEHRSQGRGPAVYSASSRQRLSARAERLARENRILKASVRRLALTDELTGLYNRRGFLLCAGQQLKLARRCRRPALLLFADLDGLKRINDAFGHREGDAAILGAAEALLRTFRESDVVARFGGDEFTVLAINSDPDGMSGILRRLDENLLHCQPAQSRYVLRMSVGAARFAAGSVLTMEELLDQADRALYDHKHRFSEAALTLAPLVARESWSPN